VDGLIRAGIGRGRDVVDRCDDSGGADATVLVRHGKGRGVGAVVVWREAEVLAVAVGDYLAVAADHVPVVRPGVRAGVGEGAGQIDGASFVDGLIRTGIGGRRDVVHGH